jgi:hypothetical protein
VAGLERWELVTIRNDPDPQYVNLYLKRERFIGDEV